MRFRAAILTALSLLAPISSATAEDIDSANWLLPGCKAFVDRRELEGQPFRAGVCAGSVNMLVQVSELLPSSTRFCAPNGATKRQAVQVAVSYINRIPGRMHEPFVQLASEAFHEAWPCR